MLHVPEEFLRLSRKDRADALGVAADASGRPAYLLEKDVWVVWSLEALFGSSFANHLVFKGGTSLSKAHRVITRFSEDVDITYDVRTLLPELKEEASDPLPATKSQAQKWTGEVRDRLPKWVASSALPTLKAHLAATGGQAEIAADGEKLRVNYDRAIDAYADYVASDILIEFGARSTGEPTTLMDVVCDAAEHLASLTFPSATPRVMSLERTFWEKATAAHVFCLEQRLRGERYVRHWYDLMRLDDAGVASRALTDRELAQAVAIHKGWFFSAKDAGGLPIDYSAAVNGALQLVPQGSALKLLADDYQSMITAGLLEEEATPFEELMARCRKLQERANAFGNG